MTMRIALVAGATGLVGQECLRLLAKETDVEEVRALVRRPLSADIRALGVRECRIDFDRLDEHPDWFQVDWVFVPSAPRSARRVLKTLSGASTLTIHWPLPKRHGRQAPGISCW